MKEFHAFIAGAILGISSLAGLMLMTGTAPKQLIAEHRQECVKRGIAEWVVKIDGTTEFKWKDKP